MADLGEFGAELDTVDADPGDPDTFTLFGHEFTLRDAISSLPMLRYAFTAKSVMAAEERAKAAAARARTDEARAAAADAMAEVEMTANAGLYAFLRDMIVPGEWDRFEQVAAEHGLRDDGLLAIASKIMAAVAGRPTRRSSGSPPGPSTTGDGSPDASPSTVPPEPAARRGRVVTVVPESTVGEPPAESPLDRARAEILAGSRTVDDLVRSGT